MPKINEAQWASLARAAKAASGNAYARYSGFRVGAAVLGDPGGVASGCNFVNASNGLTLCAAPSANSRADADGAKRVTALVVYTPTPEPVTPCGACRQVLAEFGRDAIVRGLFDGPRTLEFTAAELLPGAFALPWPTSGSETLGSEP
jgi:cytidine deaminase